MFKTLRYFCERFLFFPNNDTIQFISQEHANKSLVLDTWRIVIMHCKKKKKKKIRRFYGKIPGISLPVVLSLFLRAFTCRTFLEIKIW